MNHLRTAKFSRKITSASATASNDAGEADEGQGTRRRDANVQILERIAVDVLPLETHAANDVFIPVAGATDDRELSDQHTIVDFTTLGIDWSDEP